MPELMPASPLAYLRRALLLSVGALSLHALPACAWAQTVPDSLRACTTESDPGRRLACYDREMARLSPSSVPRRAGPTPAEPDHSPVASTQQASPTQVPPSPNSPPAQAPSEQVSPSPNSASRNSATAPTAADRQTPAPRRAPPWKKIFAGNAPERVTARVAELDRWPDAMVLHLDNGQVWQQMGRASGDLSLRVGDSVTIEKHLGSYWLSSRYVSNMKVRLKPQ
jgi:hypothetical protein